MDTTQQIKKQNAQLRRAIEIAKQVLQQNKTKDYVSEAMQTLDCALELPKIECETTKLLRGVTRNETGLR